MSYVSSLTSLYLFSCPMSPVLRLCSLSPVLCPLSHVSVPCLPSAVPSLMSLFLVSHPLSSVSRLCSLSPVPCTLYHVICSLSPILLSPSHNPYSNCPSVPFSVALYYCSCPLLFCFPLSIPPSLVLCPLSFILRECEFFLKIYMHTLAIGDFDGWLYELVLYLYVWLDPLGI
jgi:hypothetical protein